MKHTDKRYQKRIKAIMDPCIAVLKQTHLQDDLNLWYLTRSWCTANSRWVVLEVYWQDKDKLHWSVNLIECYDMEDMLVILERISIIPKVLDLYADRHARATSSYRNISVV